MLKALGFGFALFFAAPGATLSAGASPAGLAELVVGSIRDESGRPVVNGQVRAVTAAGAEAGRDRTDALGTFSIALSEPAQFLEVRCIHCAPARIALAGRSNIPIVVKRYAALETDVPDARDLAALPYGRPVDAIGLIPFAVPAADGSDVSDRGLGLGRGLVIDAGAPVVDLATGQSGLIDFPDRYVRSIGVDGPEDAFRYGNDAGGGRYSLDVLDGSNGAASLDGSDVAAGSLQPALGSFHPAYGVSDDDGILSRRGDVDLATPLSNGFLRAGLQSASQVLIPALGGMERTDASGRISYSAASREFRTYANLSATRVAVTNSSTGANDYRSAYLAADFRVERPGALALAAGASLAQQTGIYAAGQPYGFDLDGRVNQETVYVEATAAGQRTSLNAGLAFATVGSKETLAEGRIDGSRASLVPSLSVREALGGGFYARAGFSESQRIPPLLESNATATGQNGVALERGELSETALGYDVGRVRAEAIAFRQYLHGVNEQRLDGLGAAVVWQVAPLLAVRLWSLRDAPLDFLTPESSAGNVSRQVLWTTYANADALRVDLILHRDAGEAPAAFALDGDVYLPLRRGLGADIGSARIAAERRYYIGFRAR